MLSIYKKAGNGSRWTLLGHAVCNSSAIGCTNTTGARYCTVYVLGKVQWTNNEGFSRRLLKEYRESYTQFQCSDQLPQQRDTPHKVADTCSYLSWMEAMEGHWRHSNHLLRLKFHELLWYRECKVFVILLNATALALAYLLKVKGPLSSIPSAYWSLFLCLKYVRLSIHQYRPKANRNAEKDNEWRQRGSWWYIWMIVLEHSRGSEKFT